MIETEHRILRALHSQNVDRPPVVIPGGMMAGSLFSLLQQAHFSYPDIHINPEKMADYAVLLQKTCGLDNYGVPFCMTIEAEDFGAEIDLGDPLKEPRIIRYCIENLDDVTARIPKPCQRHLTTIEAIARLTGREVPVFGNIIGPTSLLTSLVEPSTVYRAMETNSGKVADALDYLSDHLIDFAKAQLAAGASVITIADPSASGEIIGKEYFRRLVAPAIKKIVDQLKSQDPLVILHICGNIMALVDELAAITWDALSVDSVVSLAKLQSLFPGRTLMGNISTHLLAVSNEDKVYMASRRAVEVAGILSPACGLSTTTMPENISSIVRAAKDAAQNLAPGTRHSD